MTRSLRIRCWLLAVVLLVAALPFVGKAGTRERARPYSGPMAQPRAEFEPSWFLVRLHEPLANVGPDGSFGRYTGIPPIDEAIRETGIYRIDFALAVSAREPVDPEALRRWGFDRTYRFHVPAGSDVLALVERFGELAGVDLAEPDFLLEPDAVFPNDPMWDDQWNLHNTGQGSCGGTSGVADSDIDAPDAWEISVGTDVVIAIVDSGIESTHPEFSLSGKLVQGRNFMPDEDPTDTEDPNGHGTGVASVAAAPGNNGEGLAGVCWNCRLMPIRIGPAYSTFADALVWAADHGARVLNMSQHADESSSTLFNGVGYAYDAGVVMTMSVGNSATAGHIPYPAAYRETIAVGGSDDDDQRSYHMCGVPFAGSPAGPELDVIAPSDFIPQATIGGGYDCASTDACGTSYSTPQVAGLVGLIESVNPSVGREEARHLIHAGADDEVGRSTEDTPGFDIYHGWGRVNLYDSLQGAEAGLTLRVEGKSATRVYLETVNPLADSWDFVRGDLSALSEDHIGVDLGVLTCIENDSPDADTAGNEDTETPPPGEAFFYLARFNAAPGAGSYGGSSRNRDRMVFRKRTEAAWSVESDQAHARMGAGDSAGDVNGDGYDDVIVGAYRYDQDHTDEGLARVYLGSSSGLASTPYWSVTSGQAESRFGHTVAAAGDVDGNGYDDVIVGAWLYDNDQTDEGRAFVYLSSASGTSESPDWTVEGDQASSQFGHWVSSAGDVNRDGYDDVLVGAPSFDGGQTDEGRLYLYNGSSTGLSTTPSWTAEPDQAWAYMATYFGPAGDLDGDGYDDIVVGANEYDGGETDEGRVFVYYGSPSGPPTTADAWIEIDMPGAWFGSMTAGAGDVNGDGFDDVIVSAPYYANGEEDEGAAFLYLGSESGLATSYSWSFETGQSGSELWLVRTAGDVNGDGYDDVLVGAGAHDGLRTDDGRAWLFLGSAAGLEEDPAWFVSGDQSGANLGYWAATAGNVNGDVDGEGDPLRDVVVGAFMFDDPEFDEGRVYVFHGPLNESDSVDCPE